MDPANQTNDESNDSYEVSFIDDRPEADITEHEWSDESCTQWENSPTDSSSETDDELDKKPNEESIEKSDGSDMSDVNIYFLLLLITFFN